MDGNIVQDSECSSENKTLTKEEKEKLDKQNSRMISDFLAKKLDKESKKHWDLFYKRNETRFFKDRHWTTREFKELVGEEIKENCVLLEVGSGVGNFIYPLLEENTNLYVYACDISNKAIDLLKQNKLYCENKIKAFQTDITTENILTEVTENSVGIITLIFVLSAVDPKDYPKIASTLFLLLKPGGYILFRDYGLYDMTQLRFKPGHKISENFYMRQDGTSFARVNYDSCVSCILWLARGTTTNQDQLFEFSSAQTKVNAHKEYMGTLGPSGAERRSYFFSVKFLSDLFQDAGFSIISNSYIHRRTVNVKEGIDVPRIFVQAKFMKPV